MAIGVDYKLFFKLSPKKLQSFDLAYKQKQKIEDELNWMRGHYVLNAFQVVMAHFGAGLSGKTSDAEYYKHPIFYFNDIKDDDEEHISNSNNEEIAVIEMKKRMKLLVIEGLPEAPS